MPATTAIAPGAPNVAAIPRSIRWVGGDDGVLELLDQTLLPNTTSYLTCRDVDTVWDAIKVLRVRGAPAIGVAAAFGLFLGMRPHAALGGPQFRAKTAEIANYLIGARPTAVNLAWAVKRVCACLGIDLTASPDATKSTSIATGGASCAAPRDNRELLRIALAEAHAIAAEDEAVCRRIGEVGAPLVPEDGGVLTHCNAGALATYAWGTALSVLYVAREQGRRFRVFADETRPLLQGARLTAYELSAAGIDVTVLCDNAAASLMAAARVQMVIVGADRIAANGDTANKIGTLGVAILARHYGLPFYVAAPRSTFDLTLKTGAEIPIEQRSGDEVRRVGTTDVAARGAGIFNPAFDVTPSSLISGIITEVGLLKPVTAGVIAEKLVTGACN